MYFDKLNLHLFPLCKVGLSGYYVSKHGEVYSTKITTTPSRMYGSKGKNKTYTLSGKNYSKVTIIDLAKEDSSYLVEIGDFHGYGPNPSYPIEIDNSNNCTLLESKTEVLKTAYVDIPNVETNETRLTIQDGIAARGWIICFIQNNQLSMSKDAKIHLTEKSYLAEMERRAIKYPGSMFVALKIVKSVISDGVVWS